MTLLNDNPLEVKFLQCQSVHHDCEIINKLKDLLDAQELEVI